MIFFIYILNFIVIGGLAYWLVTKSHSYKIAVSLGLAAKIVGGIVLGLLYQSYYNGGDTWSFFYEAERLTILLFEDSATYFNYLFGFSDEGFTSAYTRQPRALFMVKLISVLNIITSNNYWLITIYFSVFAFSGMWFLAKVLLKYYAHLSWAIIISLFFVPSVVLWSSGIIKESLAIGAIGFFVGGVIQLINESRIYWLKILLLILSFILLWVVKYYYAAALLLVAVTLVLTLIGINKVAFLKNGRLKQTGFFFIIMFVLATIGSTIHPNFYISRFLQVIVNNYEAFVEISKPGSFVSFDLQPTLASVIYNAPKAFIATLYRPILGESWQLTHILIGIENLALAIFTLLSLRYLPKRLSTNDYFLVLSAIGFIAILAIFLALSAPNFGTLIRYRTGIMPIFTLLITACIPHLFRANKS